jgi:hypothetical protein
MREFDEYLGRLRAGLHLRRSRAEEVLAEVESHLEARAAQWERMGRSRREAAEAAMRGFGRPEAAAEELTMANQRHRLVGAFRGVFAFLLSLVGGVLAFGLLEGHAPCLTPVLRWLRAVPLSVRPTAVVLVTSVLAAPGGVLAGIVAGYRGWWLAGLPMVLGGVFWLVTAQWAGGVGALLVGAPITAACALLGSRALGRPSLARVVMQVCVALLVGGGLHALLLQAHDAVGFLAAVAVAELLVGLVILAGMWGGRLAQRQTLVWVSIACASSGMAIVRAAQQPFGSLDPQGTWTAIIIVQTIFGMIVAWHYRRSRVPAARERHELSVWSAGDPRRYEL